jgi:glycosyltransferase involved in cell wall biosynthesis
VLNSCVSGGGAGRSLVAYLAHADHGVLDVHVVMPRPGVIAAHMTHGERLHFVPEFVERMMRPPFEWPGTATGAVLPAAASSVALGVAIGKITSLCRRIQPDVLYCNHMLAKPIGAAVGTRLGIPVVFHARNIHDRRWLEKRAYQGLARLDAVQAILCNSTATAATYAEVVPDKTHVVPNFVDLSCFDRARVRPALREELGLPHDALVVGYAGRLVPWKGVDVLIRAFARIHARFPSAVLAVLGDNDGGLRYDLRGRLAKLAGQLGIAPKVRFIGFRDAVAPYMVDFDVLALPSRAPEPFGRVLVEALALEVPAVITSHGGAVEVVRHGVDGLWVAPDAPDDMAAALATLLGDAHLRRRFGEAGAAHVRSAFDGHRIAGEITRSLREAALRRWRGPLVRHAVPAVAAAPASSAPPQPGTSLR